MTRAWLGVKTGVLAPNEIVKWNGPLYEFHVLCHLGVVITDVLATNEIVKWNRWRSNQKADLEI